VTENQQEGQQQSGWFYSKSSQSPVCS